VTKWADRLSRCQSPVRLTGPLAGLGTCSVLSNSTRVTRRMLTPNICSVVDPGSCFRLALRVLATGACDGCLRRVPSAVGPGRMPGDELASEERARPHAYPYVHPTYRHEKTGFSAWFRPSWRVRMDICCSWHARKGRTTPRMSHHAEKRRPRREAASREAAGKRRTARPDAPDHAERTHWRLGSRRRATPLPPRAALKNVKTD